MTKNNIKPHDHFFRSSMAEQKVAREFFEIHLPDNIKNIVDLNNLNLQHDSYIGDDLHEKIADLLYKTSFAGAEGYIYILVEHQSKPKKLMPFRILKYMIAIMEDHLKNTHGSTLPIIYPMIFYSGAKPYNYSTDLFDLFESKDLALKVFLKPYQLVDLSKVPDDRLRGLVWYGILAQAMKDIDKCRKNIVPLLEKMMGQLQEVEKSGCLSYIYATINYFFAAGEVPNEEEFREVIQQGLIKGGDEIMSYAEVLMNRGYERGITAGMIQGIDLGKMEGIEEGIEKGKAEGKAEGQIEATRSVAIRLLQLNFNLEVVAKSTGLSLSQVLELKKKVELT